MEQRRLPAAEQVQVAERVTFQDRRRTVAGHVARKGRTYAYIVTDDGIEMRGHSGVSHPRHQEVGRGAMLG